jgi:hypothetical protein
MTATTNPQIEKLKTMTLSVEQLAKMSLGGQTAAISGKIANGTAGTIEIQADEVVHERIVKGSAYRELAQYLTYERDDMGYWMQQSSPWLRQQRKALTPHERVVFEYLQDTTYWYNWVMVSRKLIAESLQIDEKTVTAAIKKLRSLELLERVEDADPENWGAGDRPSKAQLEYRQRCWAAWQDLNRISHGKGKPKTLPAVPAKATWFRVANAVMWRGHVKYMFRIPAGMVMANRTQRFDAWLVKYNQDPELLVGLLDTQRKGKAMQAVMDGIRLEDA